MMSDSNKPKHDITGEKKVRPMESIGIDSRFKHRFINKRKRGVKKLAFREVAAIRTDKEPNTKNSIEELSSDFSSPGSPSTGGFSEDGAKPIEIAVSGGFRGGGEEARSFGRPSQSSISVIGRRRVMEDAVRVAPRFAAEGEYREPYDFFAVYDGHGGARVANACRDRLHVLLAKEVEGWWRTGGCRGVDWEKAMAACFATIDEEVMGGGAKEGARMVGSTAVVVLVGKEELVVANCGDSRAVLCRGGLAVPLSRDHKPDRPDERERVEAAGGRIIDWNGSRVLGVLATSRSIGDHYLRPYVISEPEVTVTERTESDDFIVIASDGLWDVISNELACEVGRMGLNGQINWRFSYGLSGSSAADAAEVLAELAMARGSEDNISVIVVQLRKSSY